MVFPHYLREYVYTTMPDVSALLRLGDVQKIPLATNVSSATIMLEALKNKTFFEHLKK